MGPATDRVGVSESTDTGDQPRDQEHVVGDVLASDGRLPAFARRAGRRRRRAPRRSAGAAGRRAPRPTAARGRHSRTMSRALELQRRQRVAPDRRRLQHRLELEVHRSMRAATRDGVGAHAAAGPAGIGRRPAASSSARPRSRNGRTAVTSCRGARCGNRARSSTTSTSHRHQRVLQLRDQRRGELWRRRGRRAG